MTNLRIGISFYLLLQLFLFNSCKKSLSERVDSLKSVPPDTVFLVLHRFNYIDSTRSRHIEMRDSINNGKRSLEDVADVFDRDFVARDITMYPFTDSVPSPEAIERFFLLLKIKEQESTGHPGEHYKPLLRMSNYFSQELKSYSSTYKDFKWREQISDIELTIYSISDKELKLYESISELKKSTEGKRFFLLEKAGNKIEVTMNKDFAAEFEYEYAYFFK